MIAVADVGMRQQLHPRRQGDLVAEYDAIGEIQQAFLADETLASEGQPRKTGAV